MGCLPTKAFVEFQSRPFLWSTSNWSRKKPFVLRLESDQIRSLETLKSLAAAFEIKKGVDPYQQPLFTVKIVCFKVKARYKEYETVTLLITLNDQ